MRNIHAFSLIITFLLSLLIIQACSDDSEKQQVETKSATGDEIVAPGDVIARVGDQAITYSELTTMMNSSAMVGLSIPALGTPERNQAMITLLDKAISANLLYLDAKEKGKDKLTAYADDISNFEDAIIAMLYRDKILIGEIVIHEKDIIHYYNTQTDKQEDFNNDLKLAIESKLRKQRYDELKATMRERLRENVKIEINDAVLDPGYDDKRTDADVVATVDNSRVTWKEVKPLMRGADRRADMAMFYIDSDEERLKRLNQMIDNMIMARKGIDAGLEDDSSFIKRSKEFRKTRLITMHRTALIHDWNPSEDELKTFYVENMDKIVVPEMRKLQMVVLKTREEAEEVKEKIDKGEITMFQAARDYSIDPNAKSTLGEMGWVSQGSGFKELDDFTFNLEPEVVSGPVESPTGWHLIKVLDVTDAQLDNFDEPQARKTALRMYMQQKFSDYVIDLRKNKFEVAVYDDELARHFKKEADYIAELGQKAQQEGSVTEKRQTEIEQWITTPPQK